MALSDDGITGPLFVNEKHQTSWVSLDGDQEELVVLQQLLETPWMRMPREIKI